MAAPVLSSETEFSKVQQKAIDLRDDGNLRKLYRVDEVATEIADKKYGTVALQFPDHLIPESTRVSSMLTQQLETLGSGESVVYIMADTSYSPCCVDEIAAQHVKANVVVHFGHACLNPVQNIPVIYVFCGFDLDMAKVEASFRQSFTDPSSKVLIMADPQYSHVIHQLKQQSLGEYTNLVDTALKPPTDGSLVIPAIETSGYTNELLPNRLCPELDEELGEYSIFYISAPPPSSSLVLHLTTLVSDLRMLEVSSATEMELKTPHAALMRRYKYVTMARTAATVGILINTLSLRDVHSVLKQVQTWITQAGKKYYTFVVGKPNVAKLANFEVVDMWVILGCPIGGIILDSSEYYKPIITPYELNLALQAEVTWTGQWLIDFESVLTMANEQPDEVERDEDYDEDAPVFDPVTGKYVSTSRPLQRLKHVDVDTSERDSASSTQDLVAKTQSQMTIRNTVSTAADVLRNKLTWQGLGSDHPDKNDDQEEEGATVEEGRKGIARGYKVDTEDRS